MSEQTPDVQTPPDNVTPPAEPPQDPAPPTPPEPPAPEQPDDNRPGKGIDSLDDALKVIADLRAENARQRTNAKATAADEARQQIAADIAKALGIQTSDEGETPDPAVQVQELTKQVETQAKMAQDAVRELAVYKAAATVGANPAALLDSRSFLTALADVDPGDDKAVQAAITTALTNNPNFRAVQAAGPTRTDHAPGGPNSAQPKSVTEALTALYGN